MMWLILTTGQVGRVRIILICDLQSYNSANSLFDEDEGWGFTQYLVILLKVRKSQSNTFIMDS